MTALRSRRPIWGTDVMNATLGRHFLCALIVCCLIGTSAYAAQTGASGGGTGLASDSVPRHEPAPGAETFKRDAGPQEGPIKGSETTTRGSNVQNSAAWSGRQTTALHGAGSIPHRTANPPLSAHAFVSKPAAAHGYLLPRLDADRPTGRSDPTIEAAHRMGITTAPAAAGQRFSAPLPTVTWPAASLKSAAGNGVLGGPHAASRGMIGGPANSKIATKASIDGTALHRRF
jgi:hypothetical protein